VTETLAIASTVLALLLLVFGGPVTGLLIERRRKARIHAAGKAGQTEFPELHEAKLTPLERAELRVDAAWATYTNEHRLYVRAYADQYVGEEVSA
jgi:hypothetical protein